MARKLPPDQNSWFGFNQRADTACYRPQCAQQILLEQLEGWSHEALDIHGRWRQPVLRTEPFEKHLVELHTNLERDKPTGRCQSSLAWVKLLYALKIRPEDNVIEWMLATEPGNIQQKERIDLKIQGGVLIHILNIYRKYQEDNDDDEQRGSSSLDTSETHVYELSFGYISVERKESTIIANFEAGTEEQLSLRRQPFYLDWRTRRAPKPEDGVIMFQYFHAILFEISDSKAILPKAQNPIRDRVAVLLEAYDLLCASNGEGIFLLTAQWLADASRIKRRATMDGGEDDSLAKDILAVWNQMPKVQRERAEMSQRAKDVFEEIFLEMFASTSMTFQIRWPQNESPECAREEVLRFIDAHILEALEVALSAAPASSWKKSLADRPTQLVKLLKVPSVWNHCAGVVLEMTPRSTMWKSDCWIKG